MTIGEWLKKLSDKNESSEEDSRAMQAYLRHIGYTRAVVVIGVVYLEGQGPPCSIHSVAKTILAAS